MSERLVVPESGVLEHQPAARFTNAAPPFTLVTMTANPSRCVQVSFEPELLLARNHVRIGRLHVLWRWWNLLFMKRSEQIWWVRQVGVVSVKSIHIGIALQHLEEAMGENRSRSIELVNEVGIE
jgi:hypothetical protein